eukprot:1747796-Pleurochrysis_carterae.AAC.3
MCDFVVNCSSPACRQVCLLPGGCPVDERCAATRARVGADCSRRSPLGATRSHRHKHIEFVTSYACTCERGAADGPVRAGEAFALGVAVVVARAGEDARVGQRRNLVEQHAARAHAEDVDEEREAWVVLKELARERRRDGQVLVELERVELERVHQVARAERAVADGILAHQATPRFAQLAQTARIHRRVHV